MTEEGLLDLDGEILPLLPAVSGLEPLRGITLRQLLSHTSGLLDPETLERDLNEGKPLTETLKSARRLAPGSGFHYSNLGYGILGCVMESVLNQPVSKMGNTQDRQQTVCYDFIDAFMADDSAIGVIV